MRTPSPRGCFFWQRPVAARLRSGPGSGLVWVCRKVKRQGDPYNVQDSNCLELWMKRDAAIEMILLVLLALFVLLAIGARLLGQGTPAGQGEGSASVDANALVRRATQHRLDESKNHRPLRYVVRQMRGSESAGSMMGCLRCGR
jgi:hypothetical protein